MTRHGNNATNSAVYTYHERKKDTKASGYGTEHRRLGKDSIKEFDCCSLTLRPCRDPVVTPQGWLFDKEAVLKYILEKKEEYRKKLAEWEKQRDRQFQEMQSQVRRSAGSRRSCRAQDHSSFSGQEGRGDPEEGVREEGEEHLQVGRLQGLHIKGLPALLLGALAHPGLQGD